ncbi:dihydrolipoyl dehydrogenase, partial [bacterium]|nr:dihydrolipoyl dehydrogenase [bacterium]
HLQTNIKGIYALGNCTDPPKHIHPVRNEAACIIDSISGKSKITTVIKNIPICVFSQPEAASVGMSETDAIEAGFNTKTSKVYYNAVGRAVTIGENVGFVKLIIDIDKQTLLGAHMVGHSATELISQLALFRKLKIPVQRLRTTPHSSSTLSESIVEAAWKIINE